MEEPLLDPERFAARCFAPLAPRELTPHHPVEGSAGHRARASSFLTTYQRQNRLARQGQRQILEVPHQERHQRQ